MNRQVLNDLHSALNKIDRAVLPGEAARLAANDMVSGDDVVRELESGDASKPSLAILHDIPALAPLTKKMTIDARFGTTTSRRLCGSLALVCPSCLSTG